MMYQLQGMSDKLYFELLAEAENIQYLVVKGGGMATKTLVENIMMERFGGMTRSDAHSICNAVESCNNRIWRFWGGTVTWFAERSEPTMAEYPQIRNHVTLPDLR